MSLVEEIEVKGARQRNASFSPGRDMETVVRPVNSQNDRQFCRDRTQGAHSDIAKSGSTSTASASPNPAAGSGSRPADLSTGREG